MYAFKRFGVNVTPQRNRTIPIRYTHYLEPLFAVSRRRAVFQ